MRKLFVVLFILPVLFVSGCIGQTFPPDEPGEPDIQFVVPALLPRATVGVPYLYSTCAPAPAGPSDLCGGIGATLNPVGGQPPYHFQLEAGVGFPPFGISLDLNGVLRGKPTAPGTRQFSICAVDEDGSSLCQLTSLIVNPAPAPAPANVTIDFASCEQLQAYDFGGRRYELEVSGTASGPKGSELQLLANPDYIVIVSDPDYLGLGEVSCTEWDSSSTLRICAREEGPEDTEWSVFVPDDEIFESALQPVNNQIDVTAIVFKGNEILAEEQVTISCTNLQDPGPGPGPEPTAAVTIDSATCDQTYVDNFGDRHFELTVSGTASGPEGSEFQLVSNPGYIGLGEASCTAWGPSSLQLCSRDSGPESTGWSAFVSDERIYDGATLRSAGNAIDVTGRIFLGNAILAERTVTAACS